MRQQFTSVKSWRVVALALELGLQVRELRRVKYIYVVLDERPLGSSVAALS